MSAPKPWSGVIPPADLGNFQLALDNDVRPITAGTRPAVIVVDMTRRFVDSAYPGGNSEMGRPAIEKNVLLIQAARDLGIPVFFTKGYEDPAHQPRPLERGRWKLHGLPSVDEDLPPGDVIVDELAPGADDVVIYKGGRPSAFFGTPLVASLIHAGVDTVIVTGMSTSGCVRATVLDAFQYDFHVIVPFECVADRSRISHQVNLFDIHMKYADVVSLDETIAYLDSVAVALESEV